MIFRDTIDLSEQNIEDLLNLNTEFMVTPFEEQAETIQQNQLDFVEQLRRIEDEFIDRDSELRIGIDLPQIHLNSRSNNPFRRYY